MSKYPIFIPSRHRADIAGTAQILEKAGVPDFRFIVEGEDVSAYADRFGSERVVKLERCYQEEYETCDDLGLSLSVGPGAARNMAWDIAISEGSDWHWVIDDNLIVTLFRYGSDGFTMIKDGVRWFDELETLLTGFTNVVMGGPHCEFFIAHRHANVRRFSPNTRIYSFNLIRNDIPFRWRGRWNEDTILSLDILKAGFATLLSNEYLMKKARTQFVKGGNTEVFYKHGTGPKSRMLKIVYPEYVDIVTRFRRIHHYVDYRKHFGHIPLNKTSKAA